MWYIFPQLKALGASDMAYEYAIADIGMAKAYLAHPILGPRLIACTQAVLAINNQTLHNIFGSPDDQKILFLHDLIRPRQQRKPGIFRGTA